MAMTEEQAFKRAVEDMHWGARGYTRYSDFYELLYGVEFANGHRVEGKNKHDVARQADTYAQGVKNLTGEWP